MNCIEHYNVPLPLHVSCCIQGEYSNIEKGSHSKSIVALSHQIRIVWTLSLGKLDSSDFFLMVSLKWQHLFRTPQQWTKDIQGEGGGGTATTLSAHNFSATDTLCKLQL